jgi:peptide-methionine (S)-S-oxide reductase
MMFRVGANHEEASMRSVISWSVFVAVVLGLFVTVYLGAKPVRPEQKAKSLGPERKAKPVKPEQPTVLEPDSPSAGMAKATFGAGCFWCTEAVFQNLKGVQSVVSGYTGGAVKNPTYEQVCTGTTGHAEAIQVAYDPSVITYEELLEVFWQTHDPTTRDQQGNDYGPQYRSAIFYHTDEQKRLAEHYKKKLDAAGLFSAPIVTEIEPFTEFYRAEAYHQNYFNQHSTQPYCRAIIRPKMDKMKKLFSDKLKSTAAE